jgi:hypothetical protein
MFRLLENPESVSPQGKLAANAYRKVLELPSMFGIKIINPRYYINMPTDQPMKFAIWVKSLTHLGDSERHLHHCVAAFISDVAPIGNNILFCHITPEKTPNTKNFQELHCVQTPLPASNSEWLPHSTIQCGFIAMTFG